VSAIKSEQPPQVPDLNGHNDPTNEKDSKASGEDKAKVDIIKAEQSLRESHKILWKGLKGIADGANLSKFELAVETAKQVLESLHKPMKDFNRKDVNDLSPWIISIDKLKNKAQKAGKSVIAVAGGTGMGKSSLINVSLWACNLIIWYQWLTPKSVLGCARRGQAAANQWFVLNHNWSLHQRLFT